jgi:prophage DNA circulation protein
VADGIFEQFPVCLWEVTGYKVQIACKSISERGGNRLVRRARQHRNGAKLDDTGSVEKVWAITVDFYNGNDEPDVPGDEQYPGVVNFLIKSFDVHETGTLTLPNIGKRRCRLESYERNEAFDERDTATVTLNFVEDNEDFTTASTFTSPSARSVSRRIAEITTFSADQAGVALADFGAGISELASGVEALINSPFEYVGDLETKATQIDIACRRIEETHTTRKTQAGMMLMDPPTSKVLRGLREIRDHAARIVEERQSALPRLVPFVVPEERSIFDIATQLGQDASKLIKANPGLSNPLIVPKGTTVRVFASS